MKKLIEIFRKNPVKASVLLGLAILVAVAGMIFVSPWVGAMIALAGVVLLDEGMKEEGE